MKRSIFPLLPLALLLCLAACNSQPKTLPILGQKKIEGGDTLYHQISDFEFVNQDSLSITQEWVEGNIYVTDFFFTSCPTICPKMSQQMLRLQERFADQPKVKLISHSIDPYYDSPSILSKYADKLGVNTDKWQLLTGEFSEINAISDEYLVSVVKDSTVAGGYIHGGHFILVDEKRRIRGYYDGTQESQVDNLMDDIEVLLAERPAELAGS